jgi:hypothetical protein
MGRFIHTHKTGWAHASESMFAAVVGPGGKPCLSLSSNLDKALTEAPERGWKLISMKDDRKVIFPLAK